MKELLAKFREILKGLGKKDEEIDALVKDIKVEDPAPKKVDASQVTDPAVKQLIEALNQQIAILGEQNKTLLQSMAAEKDAREKAMKAQQDQLAKTKTEKVDALVAKALKDGKIKKEKEAWLKKYAEQDLNEATTWLNDAPVLPGFKPDPESKEKKNDQEKNTDLNPASLKNYIENKSAFNEAALAAFTPAKN